MHCFVKVNFQQRREVGGDLSNTLSNVFRVNILKPASYNTKSTLFRSCLSIGCLLNRT